MDLRAEVNRDLERQSTMGSNLWKTCLCGSSDKRLLTFVAMITISISILVFCFFMIANRSLTCPELNTYIGLISLILGVWLKSPLS